MTRDPVEVVRGLTKAQREALVVLDAQDRPRTAAVLRISGQSAAWLEGKGLAINVYLYEGARSRWQITDFGRAVAAVLREGKP